jgi:hypothetical protein
MNELDKQQMEDRLRRSQMVGIVFLIVLSLLFATFLVQGLLHGNSLLASLPNPDRSIIAFLVVALFCEILLLCLYAFATTLHRKIRTGSFFLSRAARAEKLKTDLEKYGPGKPFWPQSSYWITCAAASLVLLTLGAILLLTARSTWQSGCLPGPISWLIGSLFLLLVGLLLAAPVWIAFTVIRRKVQTGSFLPTTEEMRKRYIKLAQKSCRPATQQWLAILNANLWSLVAIIHLSTPILRSLRHRPVDHYSFVLSVVWPVLAVFWIWRAFQPSPCQSTQATRALLADAEILPEQEAPPAPPRMKASRLLAWCFLPWIAVSLVMGFFTFRNVHPDPVLYPPAAQARADLAAALRQAPLVHKRILLDFGWSTCGDCQAMDRFMHDPVNRALLDNNYIAVFINTDNGNPSDNQNANEDLATRYAVPLDKGVPALAVLGEDGKLIFSQQHGEFEDMRHLHSVDLTNFLTRWK